MTEQDPYPDIRSISEKELIQRRDAVKGKEGREKEWKAIEDEITRRLGTNDGERKWDIAVMEVAKERKTRVVMKDLSTRGLHRLHDAMMQAQKTKEHPVDAGIIRAVRKEIQERKDTVKAHRMLNAIPHMGGRMKLDPKHQAKKRKRRGPRTQPKRRRR